jgi:ribonuclease HI
MKKLKLRRLHLPANAAEKTEGSLGDRLRKVASFEQMRRCVGVPRDMWDAFVITDGSGTTLDNPCGYAAVLIDREEVTPLILAGAQSHGTNNAAEISAVNLALQFLVEKDKGVRQYGYRVHVLSDSSYVVQGLNRDILKWLPTMKKNKMLWLSILGAVRSGIVIKGYLIPRDTLDLNKICHDAANVARKQTIRLMAGCNQIDLTDFAP